MNHAKLISFRSRTFGGFLIFKWVFEFRQIISIHEKSHLKEAKGKGRRAQGTDVRISNLNLEKTFCLMP